MMSAKRLEYQTPERALIQWFNRSFHDKGTIPKQKLWKPFNKCKGLTSKMIISPLG